MKIDMNLFVKQVRAKRGPDCTSVDGLSYPTKEQADFRNDIVAWFESGKNPKEKIELQRREKILNEFLKTRRIK